MRPHSSHLKRPKCTAQTTETSPRQHADTLSASYTVPLHTYHQMQGAAPCQHMLTHREQSRLKVLSRHMCRAEGGHTYSIHPPHAHHRHADGRAHLVHSHIHVSPYTPLVCVSLALDLANPPTLTHGSHMYLLHRSPIPSPSDPLTYIHPLVHTLAFCVPSVFSLSLTIVPYIQPLINVHTLMHLSHTSPMCIPLSHTHVSSYIFYTRVLPHLSDFRIYFPLCAYACVHAHTSLLLSCVHIPSLHHCAYVLAQLLHAQTLSFAHAHIFCHFFLCIHRERCLSSTRTASHLLHSRLSLLGGHFPRVATSSQKMSERLHNPMDAPALPPLPTCLSFFSSILTLYCF